jgi:hypothetical protein
MKTKEAEKLLDECKLIAGEYSDGELVNLILWAYDKGWSEGIEDYKGNFIKSFIYD